MTSVAIAERETMAGLGACWGVARGDDAWPARVGAGAWGADHAVTELYAVHYTSLVKLAALWVRDLATAEEVVQDSFVAMHGGWHRLRDRENALSYLRQAVVNRARSVLRHRSVVERTVHDLPPDMPSAEEEALGRLEAATLVAALRQLSDRQREAITLRYYAGLSEGEIARAMRLSRGSVKSHTSRGMAALRAALEGESASRVAR